MPPVYTMSNQVFLIRLKDNTYAAIRFTNYMNARGIKDILTSISSIRLSSRTTTMKPINKNETYIYNIIIAFFIYSNLHPLAQHSTYHISGRVTDTEGEPLPGATISIKGKGTGAVIRRRHIYITTPRNRYIPHHRLVCRLSATRKKTDCREREKTKFPLIGRSV